MAEGMTWGRMDRDLDPEAWQVIRWDDGALMGASSSQGGALRMAHALWPDLDASLRLEGPTIVLQADGQAVGFIARKGRLSEARLLVQTATKKQPPKAKTQPMKPTTTHGDGLRVRIPASLLSSIESLRGTGAIRPTVQTVALAAIVAGLRVLTEDKAK